MTEDTKQEPIENEKKEPTEETGLVRSSGKKYSVVDVFIFIFIVIIFVAGIATFIVRVTDLGMVAEDVDQELPKAEETKKDITLDLEEPEDDKSFFVLNGVKMKVLPSWEAERREGSKVFIKTDYQPHQVYLVAEAWDKMKAEDYLKDREEGFDYTEIEGGEIFKIACGGALACNGVVFKGMVYTFAWTIESDQQPPADLDSIWSPDHDVSPKDIWDILKTATLAEE